MHWRGTARRHFHSGGGGEGDGGSCFWPRFEEIRRVCNVERGLGLWFGDTTRESLISELRPEPTPTTTSLLVDRSQFRWPVFVTGSLPGVTYLPHQPDASK